MQKQYHSCTLHDARIILQKREKKKEVEVEEEEEECEYKQ